MTDEATRQARNVAASAATLGSARGRVLTDAQRRILARRVAQKQGARQAVISGSVTSPNRVGARLSSTQEQIWLSDRVTAGGAAYNAPEATRFVGPLDPERFRAALQAVVDQHSILRTTYELDDDGRPRQLIGSPQPVLCESVDVSAGPSHPRISGPSQSGVPDARTSHTQ